MKITMLLTEHCWVRPWDFALEKTSIDQKGKVDSIYPDLKGEGQCPFWKTLKSKIHGQAGDEVKVPKSFATEVGKEYKIPLDPSYSTPCCISSGKICAHFGGIALGKISCNFKIGAKPSSQKAAAPVEATSEVPAERGAEVKQGSPAATPALEKETTLRTAQVPSTNWNKQERA